MQLTREQVCAFQKKIYGYYGLLGEHWRSIKKYHTETPSFRCGILIFLRNNYFFINGMCS
jgi:hypothetical protein